MEDIASAVVDLGLRIRRVARDELLLDCPLCGKEYGPDGKGGKNTPFAINAVSGKWQCWTCSEKGTSVKSLANKLGINTTPKRERNPELDRMIRNIRRNLRAQPTRQDMDEYAEKAVDRLWGEQGGPVLDYLRWRGFTDETIRAFGVGADRDPHGGWWVALPSRDEMGRTRMVKLRAAEQGKHAFRRVTGGQTWIFGVDLAAGEYRKIHVTEGELDAMALHQMGIRPAVSITAGAKTPPSQEVRELLTMFDEVIFVFDDDDAGRDGVRIHADVIGAYRCSTATLMRKDAAACLQDQVPAIDVQAAVMSATALGGDVVHVSKGLRQLRDPQTRRQGITTGWPKLNQMTAGGFQLRELVIVMGLTGVGKTTWTTNLAMNMALSGTGLYFMPLEGGKEAEQSKIVRMIGQKRVMDLSDQEFFGAESVIAGMPMWVCEHRGKMPIGSVRANIELAVRRHGVKVVVVDHLDFCCEDATDTREQDRVITELNQIGLDLDVVMIVVVHTKKPPEIVKQKGKEREEPPPTLYEVKGASAIVQLASYVIRVHRERRDPNRIGQSAISIMKKRPDDAREGDIAQWFDEVTLVFSDTKPILISPGGQQP